MKINVEIDCTPEEARAFLGLPDVKPMQEKLLEDMQDRMLASLSAVDPQEAMRLWLAPNLKGLDQMLAAFRKVGGTKEE
jgi:hypothetical protein